MGRDINQMIAELSPTRQAHIDARYRALKHEVESLGELRRIAG